jgi:alpha-1,2-mannosyltransferase
MRVFLRRRIAARDNPGVNRICKDEKIGIPRTMNSEVQPQCCAAVSGEIERGPKNLFRWPRRPRDAWLAAIALWVIPTMVVSVLAGLQPLKRTVTPLYHAAAAQWWAGQPLYNGPKGMNYLPHFALLFSPFHLLPLPVAEVVWRCCAAALIAGGLWQVMQMVYRSEAERPFLWATVLTMPLCMSALRNGQANALFGGLTLISIAALLRQRWWLASGLMVLAIAVKPLGIVLVMLAPFVYRPLRWRVLLTLLALAVFPFLFANPPYVLTQHQEMLINLRACAAVTQHRFADINGLLRTFGIGLGPQLSTYLRALMGICTLFLWFFGARRVTEPLRAFWLYALTATYLMLFNPMTEQNSYVIFAPVLGVWGAFFLFNTKDRLSRPRGWAIVAMALSMGLLPNIVRPLFHNYFALAWYPFMAILFMLLLFQFVLRSPQNSPTVQNA